MREAEQNDESLEDEQEADNRARLCRGPAAADCPRPKRGLQPDHSGRACVRYPRAGAAAGRTPAEQLFNEGKDVGLSELQMYEAVLNLLPYIGYPRTLSTLITLSAGISRLHQPTFPGAESAADRTLAGIRPNHLGRTRDADSRAADRRQ